MSSKCFSPSVCQGALILQQVQEFAHLNAAGTDWHTCSMAGAGGNSRPYAPHQRFSPYPGQYHSPHPAAYPPISSCSWSHPHSGTGATSTTTIFDFFWEQANAKVGVSLGNLCGFHNLGHHHVKEVDVHESNLPKAGVLLGCYKVYLYANGACV